jgi:ribonuclease BN (tRNA processing enzyme)
MPRKVLLAISLIGAALSCGPLSAAPARVAAAGEPMVWTTLGTAGGPVVHADRSQPANLLTIGGRRWLVDCGDGCLERLAATGAQPGAVDVIFISHLHLDHTAGLQGLIGLRWMQSSPKPLTIYGPPGIDRVVAGLIASMQPVAMIDQGQKHAPPADTIKVITLEGGSDLTVDGVRVRTVRNSHFDITPGSPADNGTQSLSYRFDVPGYAIGYTGDTGASAAVATLFKGTDLLVSEVIDLPGIITNLSSPQSPIPAAARPALIEHLKTQHLTPEQAGKMAADAGARRLVFTHLSIAGPTVRLAPVLIRKAQTAFRGQVLVAHDLDSF